MVDCLKCYRLQKCGDDLYYCPFFNLNPCLRGRHYVGHAVKADAPAKQTPVNASEIPAYKPARGKGKFTIDWEKWHDEVFKMHFAGHTDTEIARRVGVTVTAVAYYMARYY